MKNESAGVAQLGNWYAVAAVAAASFGLAGGAQDANAVPVVVHPVGGPVTAPPTSTIGAVIFNLLDTTGTQFITVPPPPTSSANLNVAVEWTPSGPGTNGFAIAAGKPGVASVLIGHGETPSHLHYAAKLGGGAAINSSVFGFGTKARSAALLGGTLSSTLFGNWEPGDTGFIGLAVFASSLASVPNFGWAEFHLGSNYDPTLIAWGFNTTAGAPDFTPNLPEPSSLLLLASGAAGLAAYRRRRAQRRAAAA